MSILAVIPARGGSKRIPKKNIKLFAGKPIIAYSIEAAMDTGIFDRIIVSTDSEAISTVAKKYGAEVPFIRPKNLSDDYTPTAPVLQHTLDFFAGEGVAVNYLCCIYATAPFIQSRYIIQGFKQITKQNVSSAFSVTTFAFPIFRALKITKNGHIEMFWPEHELTRSNDLPEAYHDAGQFYWLDCKSFLKTGKLYSPDARPVILPRFLVQDIDTPEDWKTAEHMFNALSR